VKVSKRQRQIIEMLIERKNEMTAAEIAQVLKLSTRTIHRELPEIEAILYASGVTLQKKAGTGIQIYASPEDIDHLKKHLLLADSSEYSPDERKVLVICRLLETEEPIKLFALSYDLQAAIPTISSDLDELQSWLERQGLTLVRRRGYGVELNGSERAKRKMISLLVLEHLADSVLFGSGSEPVIDPVSNQLLMMIGHDQFFRVEKVLWCLDKQEQTNLTENDYTFLLIQLSIAITRYQQHMRIEESSAAGQDMSLSEAEHERYRYFADAMELTLPLAEQIYITELLMDWKKTAVNAGLLQDDLKMLDFVTRLIHEVGDELGSSLAEDQSLKEGLMQHMERVFHRIASGEPIRNPLLSQIRRDYETLFAIIQSVSVSSRMNTEYSFPDEEIAYLVMHFGASIERLSQRSLRVRALLVCTSGIGSSKLLAVRLQKELPQLELVAHISWFEAARFEKDAYDLVISTVDLPLPSDQYVRASPLLTQDEVARLRQFIHDLPMKERSDLEQMNQSRKPTLGLLSDIRHYAQQIVPIIERFHVYPVPSHSFKLLADLREIVVYMCGILTKQGLMVSSEEIVERILAREQQGSQIIGSTELALFHTRSESVDVPSLSLFRFESPISWTAASGRQIGQILFMIGPLELDKQTLEVLSEFSAMLLEPGMIDRLAQDDEQSIKHFYSARFEQFIKTKLEWRE
jgi:mannitol operon transcriptional antiterminator